MAHCQGASRINIQVVQGPIPSISALLVLGCGSQFFSMSSSKGPPRETSVTAGGVSLNGLKCPEMKRRDVDFLHHSFLSDRVLFDDDDIPWTRPMSLWGYILTKKGRETIRQALMIVMLDSMTVQMVAVVMSSRSSMSVLIIDLVYVSVSG